MRPLSETELNIMFDEYLDGCYRDVIIADRSFRTSYALKMVDGAEYKDQRDGFLEDMVDGEQIYFKNGNYYDSDTP